MPWWLVPLFAFGVFLMAHVLLWRMRGRQGIIGLWPLCLLALVSYGLIGGVWVVMMPTVGVEGHWAILPPFAFLVMCYLHFYYGVLRSVTVRLLGELWKLQGGPVPIQTLQRGYSPDELLDIRLQSLVDAQWVSLRDGHYVLESRGCRVARFAHWLKRLYHLEVSG